MKDYTNKHGIIVNSGNRINQFITTVELNLNINFNEIIKFIKPFSTVIVINNNQCYLWDH